MAIYCILGPSLFAFLRFVFNKNMDFFQVKTLISDNKRGKKILEK